MGFKIIAAGKYPAVELRKAPSFFIKTTEWEVKAW